MALMAITAHAQIIYATSGSTYNQNFDALANSGTSNVFTDNVTILGLYSNRETYIGDAGTSTTGGLHSYGATSSTERAIGTLASSTADPVIWQLRLRNSTGDTLTSFTLNYTGEQWRVGGATSVNNTLAFSYSIKPAAAVEDGGIYTAVTALDFDSIIDSATSGGSLDGNAAANRIAIGSTVSGISWGNGTDIWLRFSDVDEAGVDHGLGVDDLSFRAVPEPTTIAMLMGGFGMLTLLRRRRA